MFKTDHLTTKAVVYKNNSSPKVSYAEKQIPLVPKGNGTFGVVDDEILVKIHAAAFNPVDFGLRQLAYPIFNYLYQDFGLCHDYSGEVVDIGKTAQEKFGFEVGDFVCGHTKAGSYKHTLTQYVAFETKKAALWSMTKVPKNLSMEEAGSFSLVYSTASMVVEAASLGDDARVLVNGGSTSVGSYVVSLLKTNPKVKEVVATCSSRSEEKVKSLGADRIIDYTKTANLTNDVLELCKNSKFDTYLDCAGSDVLLRDASQFVVKDGAVVLITAVGKKDGGKSLSSVVTIDFVKQLLLTKLGKNPVQVKMLRVTPGAGFDRVGELFESGKIKPFVHSVFPFEQAQEAFDLALSGKVNGKVVVKVTV